MSTLIRSALVALALVGSVSAASAHSYGHGHGHGHGYWTKSHGGKWHHNTRAFFDQLKKNGS